VALSAGTAGGDGPASDLAALIALRGATFSPNDRRIAEHLLRSPAEASFESADTLARKIGVSKAAVVRFGVRLGLGGFAGLQEALATEVRRRLATAGSSAPAVAADDVLARRYAAVETDLRASVEATGADVIARAAAVLETGEGWIHVFGQRASAAIAEYAYFLLNPLLPNVIRVEAGESAIADHLMDIGPEDRLLAFTFRRYAKLTTEVVSFFADAGAPVVLVTDSASAPAAARATETIVCANDAPQPFPTAVTGIFLLEVLVAAVVERNPATAARRLGDAQRVWGRFGTY
jgi:DNA-binding MurR/RpiR family transcriptional regulator